MATGYQLQVKERIPDASWMDAPEQFHTTLQEILPYYLLAFQIWTEQYPNESVENSLEEFKNHCRILFMEENKSPEVVEVIFQQMNLAPQVKQTLH